jgi:flagella basal body P-ring formation protein FlgA
MRALAILAAVLAATLAFASPALAGQSVTLRADTADADGVVTLGDLFDGAGQAANVAVAARQGTSVALDALAVQRVARNAGLDWPNAEGLRTIVVHAGLNAAGSSRSASRGNVEVLTYTRSLGAGEIVQPADLVWAKAAAAPDGAPSDAQAVIGQAAKRPLRAGAVVQARDIGAAQVIKAGEIVTVTYEADGISLALQGKAMGAAGVGEVLAVQNPISKKVVQAVVTGPGQAVVGPEADQMKSAHSLRYAVR